MANTYSQIYIQVVFTVKGRQSLKSFKDEYHEFLEKFQVDFNHKYLFDWVEN